MIVVHRDLGPDFKHDTSGAPCPCAPVVFDAIAPNAPTGDEQIAALMTEGES